MYSIVYLRFPSVNISYFPFTRFYFSNFFFFFSVLCFSTYTSSIPSLYCSDYPPPISIFSSCSVYTTLRYISIIFSFSIYTPLVYTVLSILFYYAKFYTILFYFVLFILLLYVFILCSTLFYSLVFSPSYLYSLLKYINILLVLLVLLIQDFNYILYTR